MYSGSLSYVLLIFILILLATGWKNILLKGIPSRLILFFCVLWAILSNLTLFLETIDIKMNGIVLLLSIIIIWGTIKSGSWKNGLWIWGSGLLIGIFGHLEYDLAASAPSLALTTPEVDYAIFLMLIAAVFFRRPVIQLPVISLSLLVTDFITIVDNQSFGIRQWGGPHLWDLWWLTLIVTRVFSIVYILIIAYGQRLKQHLIRVKHR